MNEAPSSVWEKGPLDGYTLRQPLYLPCIRHDFLSSFFDVHLEPAQERHSADNYFAAFFAWYGRLCELAANRSHTIPNLTHHQLCQIKSLIAKPGATRHILLLQLQDQSLGYDFDTNAALTILDLCASVWFLMTIGGFPGDPSYDEPLLWVQGPLFTRSLAIIPDMTGSLMESLQIASDRTFTPIYTSKDIVKFPQSFTAAHLEEIAGIEVCWTDSLADHLLLKDDDTKLFIFHHVSMLHLYMRSPSSPYPWQLMRETERTISLLLPPVLGKPNPWFEKVREAQSRNLPLDVNAGLCPRLNSTERQIGKFLYWRDRLVLLKRTYDEAEPRTLRQLWMDDRKKQQWFTFWVAVLVLVLTVVFGVVQSVGTWVQAWASIEQLHASSGSSKMT